MLQSPVPIVTLWGEDGVMIYNDAYSVFAGGRHPCLLGSKVREGWPEVADFNELKQVLEATQGNLSVQLRKLEEAGYVTIEKSFLDRKPLTRARVTAAGVKAFRRYLDTMTTLVRSAPKR